MNTENRLVLEDESGNVVRTYAWNGKPVQVVRRGDTRRLELASSLDLFKRNRIPYEFLGDLSPETMRGSEFSLGATGKLRLLPKVEQIAKDEELQEEKQGMWYLTLAGALIASGGLIGVLMSNPPVSLKNEEALKQEVIKIVKQIPVRQKVAPTTVTESQNQQEVKPTTQPKSIDRLKRMGALGALGSLSKSKQMGGLNLNAANTTAGPGLGGTQGSGGTQTSLYAKGLTSAPLGAGGKVEGAGGYGTKGKGGGQAGFGKMSLVGSTGAAPIGLAHEASVDSGLDRDQIAAVINRNLGQVRFCYEQGLQGDPNLAGRVAVGFTIGGNGAVKIANVENTSLNSKAVEDCILLRLKSWKFPLPSGGVDVKVISYPFLLRRTGQG
ncbi:MAG TPA: AgmX/PglI C-terminal domain-containing protein [Bdellovibrionales bacterium]|nr:AgmX/PglI C-terminal domain-containing protein [Bdellovibrionales bacterium]